VTEFLSRYTELVPYEHRVTAQIRIGSELKQVPFPYSKETLDALGRQDELSIDEIKQLFFYGYSNKMWGTHYDNLPETIKGRVPIRAKQTSTWFDTEFTALPKYGYTTMVERMFDGCEIRLGARSLDWMSEDAKTVIYCGRTDLIPIAGVEAGAHIPVDRSQWQVKKPNPEWITLRYKWVGELNWFADTAVVNFCDHGGTATRAVCHRLLTGGCSDAIHYEMPGPAEHNDINPSYPFPTPENQERQQKIADLVLMHHKNVKLLGRTATYRYLDMWKAVRHALDLAEELGNG
jgi:UDP-galactopyranose mutase